jgi:uncharacterized protein (TIGR02594 family)
MKFELRSLIAQTHLLQEGHYTGKLDGFWGPLSIAAAEKWDDAEVQAAIPAASGPTPYDLARRHLGEKEIPGKKDNPLIVRWLRLLENWIQDDETAWCSAFVDAMAREAGYERSGELDARSWLQIGEEIAPAHARKGDVVIFWRVSKSSWQGHVGFVVSRDAERKSVLVLGGNQNNAVTIQPYPETQLLGYRRLRHLSTLQGNTSRIL